MSNSQQVTKLSMKIKIMERPVQKCTIYKKRIWKTEMWAKEMRTCNKNKSLFL